jgi:endonuclease YncB( thermonuclease family)
MAKPTWRAEAQVIEVLDADTFKAAVDLGWRIALTTSIRIEGINAPEIATAAGVNAKAYLQRLLIPGAVVLITSHRLDKYGRCQASVQLADGGDLGSILITTGHAAPMPGYSPKRNDEAQPGLRPQLGFDITAPRGG